ncbi:uncharacterized protein LOC100569909 isoform X1 [Acyrthosiphon pisum]|uniref:Uncharacterized protein n=1 Tax=Acyrthosiphon pisum TaxID=7029 RepID=A0A8R2H9I0_ACYPI|nr:uncharacterized protein LOC100569909 isoform X1 [Acyrthosiphon pisum]|eukprot:XP_016660377.1 PREDICTED: uncharacterized protein LOC100569909 isoform X1 [Acyrthosiphon pisum]
MSAPCTSIAMDQSADTIKYVPIKTFYFKTEEDILRLFKINKIQYKTSIYEVVSKNINRISLKNNCFNPKVLDCVLIEANMNKLVVNCKLGFSIIKKNSQLVDVAFNNVRNEINEFISTFIKILNEEDRILIIDGLVFGNSTNSSISKSLISVRPEKNSSIILLKLTDLSLEYSNLLQNKNLAKITGPGIYLLFGNIKAIIRYTDEEFMLLRIQSYDKCYIRVRKYPHNIHNFNNISGYETMIGVKSDMFSYKVDILVKKPSQDFLSLLLDQQIILYNIKVIHSNNSGIFSLCVNGKSTNLKAHKVIPKFEKIPTTQHISEPSCDDNISYSPSSPECLKTKPDQNDNNIYKRANCSSHNENMNNNNNEAQMNGNYEPNKIIKPNPPTYNQVQQYNNRWLPRVSSLCIDETNFINETNLPIQISDVQSMPFNSNNSQNTTDSTNVNNREVLGVSSLRCIGPCKPICIEPYLNDDYDSINLVSGYCRKCYTFTPITFLTPHMDDLNNEYKCLRCRNVLFLTFFFKLNFLYGENNAQSIELICYNDKAIDLINQLTKKDIKVKDYLSHYSYRQTVVDAMRNFIFKHNNIIIVFHDLPSDNVHIFVSLSTMIDLKVETI